MVSRAERLCLMTLFVMVIATAAFSWFRSRAGASPETPVTRFDRIEANQITVGNVTILKTGENMAGIWMDAGDGRGVAIYADRRSSGQGPVISLHHTNNTRQPGFDLALTLDRDGTPYAQVRGKDGKLKFVNLATLAP